MTDRVTYGITTEDAEGNSLTVACYPKSHVFAFTSDLFLAAGRAYGDLEYRFDDEPSMSARVLMSDHRALLGTPLAYNDGLKAEGELPGMVMDASMFEVAIVAAYNDPNSPGLSRLRVRLSSVLGEKRDLSFNVTGMRSAMRSLDKRCGFNR